MPHGVGDPRDYLAGLGLTERQVEFVLQFVARHGSLFEAWGVPKRVVELVRSLRASSGCSIATRLGGRRCCVFGSLIFNSPFALATPSWMVA